MFCPKCGAQLPDGAKFCTTCGAAMPAAAAENSTPAEEPVYAPTEEPVYAPVGAEAPAEAEAPEYAPADPYAYGYDNQPPEYGTVEDWTTPQKKGKKGLIIGVCAAVAAVALIAVLFFTWIYPSYLSAEAKYERAFNQAEAALSDEDYDAAVEHYTAALERAANGEARIDCFVGRGDAYMGQEEYEKAIDDYESALDLDEDQRKVWNKLADAYLAADDEDGARQALADGVEATGASSLSDRLDEMNAAAEPAPEETAPDDTLATPDADEITLGGQTFSTDATELYLSYCSIEDISALSACTELVYLDLSGNYISDLTPLTRCTKLEELCLDENNVYDLTPLAGMTNLTFLSIESNQVEDLTPLARLTDLETLWLYDNDVANISALSGLTSLRSLELWGNPVSDLSALSRLTTLSYLDLDDTLISDVTPLLGLTNLETLYLSGDNLPADAWDIVAAALPQFSDHASTPSYENTLVVGICPDYPPYESYDGDGTLIGYDVDLAYMIGDQLGVNVEFVDYDFDSLFAAVASGEVDLILSAIAYTDERGAMAAASDPYLSVNEADGSTSDLCIFAASGDPMGLIDSVNEIIGGLRDSGMLDALSNYWAEYQAA